MIFTNKSRISSSNSASSSSIVTNKKKTSHQSPVEDEFSQQMSVMQRKKASMIGRKIRSMGPICKSKRKITHSSWRMPNEEDERESDYLYQFVNEKWPNDHNDDRDDSCMWLSSGNSSPSCCFDDKIFGNLLELSLDDWVVSVLIFRDNSSSPIFGRATSFFDGSRVNPLEEASFVLQRASSFDEEILEEEITTWLMSSLEADEISPQSYTDCNVWDHSSYSNRGDLEFPEIWEFEGGILGSLVDLEDGENSGWISDTELNILQIDFPSPSFKSCWSSNISHSSDFVSSTECFAQAQSKECTTVEIDEPIFWPLAQNFYLSLDFSWDFCIMSPQKIMCNILLQNYEMDFSRRQRNKLPSKPTLESTKILEKKHEKGDDDHVKLIKNTPNGSMELIRSFFKDDFKGHENEEYFKLEETVDLDNLFLLLEEEFPVVQELPIEKLLGLDEFDGHEGIELEFHKDSFVMDESFEGIFLWKV